MKASNEKLLAAFYSEIKNMNVTVTKEKKPFYVLGEIVIKEVYCLQVTKTQLDIMVTTAFHFFENELDWFGQHLDFETHIGGRHLHVNIDGYNDAIHYILSESNKLRKRELFKLS